MRFVEEEKLLSCVHCGFCLEACPTYLEDGVEADSPRGRILLLRALEEGRIEPDETVRGHLDSCLGCRACETACPAGVPYGELIEKARPFVEPTRPWPARIGRRLLGQLIASPIFRRPAFALLRPLLGAPWLRTMAARLPLPLLPWAAALPADPERDAIPRMLEPRASGTGQARGTVLLLEGCVAESAFRATNRAMARLLAYAGYRVRVMDAGCCGALPLHLGDAAHACQRSRDTIEAAGDLEEIDWVVPTAAGCGAHLRELTTLLPGEKSAQRLAARVRDPLVLLAEADLPPPPETIQARVALHHACHLLHAQGIAEEVERLVNSVPGVQLVDLAEADICCGSAGTYNLTEREMAARLGRRKVDHITASGAEIVLAANPGCLLQIGSGLLRRGTAIRFEHPIDFLARAYGLCPNSNAP